MGTNIHLFALSGEAFAQRLRAEPREIVRQVKQWAKDQGLNRRAVESKIRVVEAICRGELRRRRASDVCLGLAWIGDATLERIRIPEFCDLKRCSDIEEYGILEGLSQHPCPFPLPRSNQMPPFAGYLPCKAMPRFKFHQVSKATRMLTERYRIQVDAVLDDLSRQLLGRRGSARARGGLSWEQVEFARRRFSDVLETLIEDQLDLLAVVL